MKKRQVPLTAFSRYHEDSNRADWTKIWGFCLTIFFQISIFSGALVNPSWATTNETSSHQIKILEIPIQTGSIPRTLTFPLYEQGAIQYFSAGLGKEERRLTYPPFPLKLIFVQGERAFLAGVSVHLAKEDGTTILKIPGKEVEGPWLFINMPTGTYIVSGIDSNGTTIEKIISVQTDKPIVVHFRWP